MIVFRQLGKAVTQRPVQIGFWAGVLVVLGGGWFFGVLGFFYFFLDFLYVYACQNEGTSQLRGVFLSCQKCT